MKNKMIAEFVGIKTKMIKNILFWELKTSPHTEVCSWIETQYLDFDENYNSFMLAWVKFRDLQLDVTPRNYSEYENICMRISSAITHQPITEAFDELVKGIEWYKSFKQNA